MFKIDSYNTFKVQFGQKINDLSNEAARKINPAKQEHYSNEIKIGSYNFCSAFLVQKTFKACAATLGAMLSSTFMIMGISEKTPPRSFQRNVFGVVLTAGVFVSRSAIGESLKIQEQKTTSKPVNTSIWPFYISPAMKDVFALAQQSFVKKG